MQCMQCGGMQVTGSDEPGRQSNDWSSRQECACLLDADPVTRLLRLLTLLANCGLSAGAPPVLQGQQHS